MNREKSNTARRTCCCITGESRTSVWVDGKESDARNRSMIYVEVASWHPLT